MQISCIPICLFKELLHDKTLSLKEWINMAVDLGLDGIEMYEPYLDNWDESYMAELADTVYDAGLQISMFTSYSNFSSPDIATREQETAHVKQAVDAAVTFRTNIVRLTAGSWIDGLSQDEVLQNIADGLKGCLNYASEKQVMLALEDHPVVGTKIGDFVKILELVGDERLKVNLDTSNPMVSNDNPVDLAKLVVDRVVHLHASDRLKNLQHCREGTGEVDFEGVFKVLKSAGYDGWISLEAGGNGKEDIRRSIEYIGNTWNEA